jgi:cold shock CspA family protein
LADAAPPLLRQSDLHAEGFRSLREGEAVHFKMGLTEEGAARRRRGKTAETQPSRQLSCV